VLGLLLTPGQPPFVNMVYNLSIVISISILHPLYFSPTNTHNLDWKQKSVCWIIYIYIWNSWHISVNTECNMRPSDRLRGGGTAQFGESRTTHNSQNSTKSCTILKDLLKHLIKSGILLITKIPKNFLGYFRVFPFPNNRQIPRFPW